MQACRYLQVRLGLGLPREISRYRRGLRLGRVVGAMGLFRIVKGIPGQKGRSSEFLAEKAVAKDLLTVSMSLWGRLRLLD